MKRQRYSNLDVRSTILELRTTLLGMRLNNLYDVSETEFLLKFTERNDRRVFVFFESGVRLHLTDYEREKPKIPSPFALKLRKHIRSARLVAIDQLAEDRIIDFTMLALAPVEPGTGGGGGSSSAAGGGSADTATAAFLQFSQPAEDSDGEGDRKGAAKKGGSKSSGASKKSGAQAPIVLNGNKVIFHLIFELHQRANLVLTDAQYNVVALRKIIREDYVTMMVKQPYPFKNPEESRERSRYAQQQFIVCVSSRAPRHGGGANHQGDNDELFNEDDDEATRKRKMSYQLFNNTNLPETAALPQVVDPTMGLLRGVTEAQVAAALEAAPATETLKKALNTTLGPYGSCVVDHIYFALRLKPNEVKGASAAVPSSSAPSSPAAAAASPTAGWGSRIPVLAQQIAGIVSSIEMTVFNAAPLGRNVSSTMEISDMSGMSSSAGDIAAAPASPKRSQAPTHTVRGYLFGAVNTQPQPPPSAFSNNHSAASADSSAANNLLDFAPIDLQQFSSYPDKYVMTLSTFSRTVEQFYVPLEQKRVQGHNEGRENTKVGKVDKFFRDHQRRIEELKTQEEKNEKIASIIFRNAEKVDQALQMIREVLKSKISWERFEELLKVRQAEGHPVAQIIHELKLKKNMVTLLLFSPFPKPPKAAKEAKKSKRSADDEDEDDSDDDSSDDEEDEEEEEDSDDEGNDEKGELVPVEVDFTLTSYANASKYHATRKQHVDKLQRTLQSTEKAAEAARKKGERVIQKDGLKARKELIMQRGTFWFEKFLWFQTSTGFLVVIGKDATQTDVILRKYYAPGDVFVHCDGFDGAQPALLKNHPPPDTAAFASASTSSDDHLVPMPISAIEEAGAMVVCRSKAWEDKTSMSAWWVPAYKVSKTSAQGDVLPPGAFHLNGASKQYLRPMPLEVGFALVFVSDPVKVPMKPAPVDVVISSPQEESVEELHRQPSSQPHNLTAEAGTSPSSLHIPGSDNSGRTDSTEIDSRQNSGEHHHSTTEPLLSSTRTSCAAMVQANSSSGASDGKPRAANKLGFSRSVANGYVDVGFLVPRAAPTPASVSPLPTTSSPVIRRSPLLTGVSRPAVVLAGKLSTSALPVTEFSDRIGESEQQQQQLRRSNDNFPSSDRGMNAYGDVPDDSIPVTPTSAVPTAQAGFFDPSVSGKVSFAPHSFTSRRQSGKTGSPSTSSVPMFPKKLAGSRGPTSSASGESKRSPVDVPSPVAVDTSAAKSNNNNADKAAGLDKRRARKLKKIQDKYGEQDDEDRAAAMAMIGNRPSKLHRLIEPAADTKKKGGKQQQQGGKHGRKGQESSESSGSDDDEEVDDDDVSEASTPDGEVPKMPGGKRPGGASKSAAVQSKGKSKAKNDDEDDDDAVMGEHADLRRRTQSQEEGMETLKSKVRADFEASLGFSGFPRGILQRFGGTAEDGDTYTSEQSHTSPIRYILLMVAPFASVAEYAFKVRVSPGTGNKKGVLYKDVIQIFDTAYNDESATGNDRKRIAAAAANRKAGTPMSTTSSVGSPASTLANTARDQLHTLIRSMRQDDALQQMITGVKLLPFGKLKSVGLVGSAPLLGGAMPEHQQPSFSAIQDGSAEQPAAELSPSFHSSRMSSSGAAVTAAPHQQVPSIDASQVAASSGAADTPRVGSVNVSSRPNSARRGMGTSQPVAGLPAKFRSPMQQQQAPQQVGRVAMATSLPKRISEEAPEQQFSPSVVA